MHHDDEQNTREPGSKDTGTENRSGSQQTSKPGGGTSSGSPGSSGNQNDRRLSPGSNSGESWPRSGDRNERDRSQRSDSQQ